MDLDIQPLAASHRPEYISGFLHFHPDSPPRRELSAGAEEVGDSAGEGYTEKGYVHTFIGQYAQFIRLFEALRGKPKPLLWPY